MLKAAKASLKAKPIGDAKQDEEHVHAPPASPALQFMKVVDEASRFSMLLSKAM